MKLVILKDGTVPLAIAKVVATDAAANLDKTAEELAESDGHELAELFDVADDSRFAYVTWADGWGFEVSGFPTQAEAIATLEDGEPGSASLYHEGHWGRVYHPGDNEGYGHVFELPV